MQTVIISFGTITHLIENNIEVHVPVANFSELFDI